MGNDDLPTAPSGDDSQLPAAREHYPEARAPQAVPNTHSLITTSDKRDDDELDLMAYWRLLVKRRWLILGVLSAVLAVTLVWTLLQPSIYRATATLKISPYGMQVMQVRGMSPMQGYNPGFKRTQLGLMQSRSLARRVAGDLQLAGSDIFQRLQPPGWMERVHNLLQPGDAQVALAAGVGDAGLHAAAEPAVDGVLSGGGSAPSAEQMLARATGLVQGGLGVEPVRNSHLVRIHYTSTLPKFAARVANAVADGFIAASIDRRYGATSYAQTYLEDKLAMLRSRLQESRTKLVQYAKDNNIVPSGEGVSLVEQNLTDLNRQLAQAQAQRIRTQARWEQVQGARNGALPADMLEQSILPSLQQRRAQLQAQYQNQLRTFKPDYPSMVALKAQIQEVGEQINQALAKIRASVKAKYEAAVARESKLEAQLDTLRRQSLEVAQRSIQYKILKRDVDTNQQLYEALLQRYKQVKAAGGAKVSNISVVDRALVPGGRFSPSLRRNLMLGALLGLFLGVGLALLLEYLDNTLKSPKDIEELLGLGVLGIIPKLRKQTPWKASEDPRSAFSESYRSVRTALQFSSEHGIPKILLLTSPGEGEGKSTSALALARNFAQLGKRVLLVEGDLRAPSLGRAMGLSSPTGLSSLLSSATSLQQALVATDDDNLDVLLSGPLPPSPTELLAGRKFASLMAVAGNEYDQVIIDGPPVLGIADAPILANAAKGTLLVVKSGATRIDAAQAAVKRLHMARGQLTGCLLTQYDARESGYHYSYEGYYGYGVAPQLGNG